MNAATIRLSCGLSVPRLGLGTGGFGADPSRRRDEIRALQLGLDLGLTLIDTAEMYADGGAEQLVGEAIASRRDEAVLVTKIFPQNATAASGLAHCEASLRRLNVDVIDLYLVHWCIPAKATETLDLLLDLQRQEKIRHYGVSNYQMHELDAAWQLPAGPSVATNQVIYNLRQRGVEGDMLPALRERGDALMAYAPLDQGRPIAAPALNRIAGSRGLTEQQVALAWVLNQPDVFTVVQSSSEAHVRENAAARDIVLSPEERTLIDGDFPPPAGPVPLARV